MRVNYVDKQKVYKLGEIGAGEIIRPTNSQELYLTSGRTVAYPLFHGATDRELLYEVENPQDIDFDCFWDSVLCVTRIDDGALRFMPSETKVEIMNCYLNVEGE